MNIILTDQKCVACEGGVSPLTRVEAEALHAQVPKWELSDDAQHLSRHFICKNFQAALDFMVEIGTLAEQEGHHPDLHLTNYKHLTIDLSTHAIGGLSQNDFILAAKIDVLGK